MKKYHSLKKRKKGGARTIPGIRTRKFKGFSVSAETSATEQNSKKKNVKKKESLLNNDKEMITQPKRLNEAFVDILEQCSDLMLKQGEPFRARAYQKAEETIMNIPDDITDPEQLKGKPGIGDTILEKLKEYKQTGTLKLIEREKTNPIYQFTNVYGIGPKKAKELVEKGITTIDELRAKQDEVLNDVQRVGLKYYKDILQRIPRDEIDEYNILFQNVFKEVTQKGADPGSKFEIVGSYRRGAATSGDIDMIITSTNPSIFKTFVERMIKEKILVEILSRGSTKCLVIAKLPHKKVARRVDFLYTTPEEYPFAVLYFTGSKYFNAVMRGRALSLGYSMNEHGLKKESKKGAKVEHIFTSEKDIFDFLGMEYKTPEERIDGRAVVPFLGIHEPNQEPNQEPNPEPNQEPNPEPNQEPNPEPNPEPNQEPSEKKQKKTKKKTKKDNTTLEEVDLTPSKDLAPPFLNVDKDLAPPFLKVDKDLAPSLAPPFLKVDKVDNVESFKTNGIQALNQMSESELADMIEACNDAFHNDKEPLLSDNQYDIVKEYMEKKFPKNQILKEIGATVEKNKVKLPYEMASMDKIKPDTHILTQWKEKYKGPYVISCKLDGVSGLYSTEQGTPKLYTRGNGTVGQDVSHLLPFLNLPKDPNIVVRGECILPKKVFQEKYATQFSNIRNLVAGIVNRQTIDEKAHDLRFVCYEVIQPSLKPSEQMAFLKKHGFETVQNETRKDISNESLSDILVDWRTHYLYEIDGIIISNDVIYPRKSGNPDHAFAFKMVLSDQIAEAKVVDVIWTPSKDGYLKPRIQIEPIQLGGVKIEYATGFNGAFIKENKIGIGALVQIIRSGDVIPHIKSITVPAPEAKMPSVPYKWNDTHIDVLLEDISSDTTVREKVIAGFFRGIDVEGLSSGNVARLVKAGYNTIPKIIHMTTDDFLHIEGFQSKMANKLYTGIHEKLKAATLIQLMSASNLLGRGISEKKMEPIMEAHPDILLSSASTEEKIQQVSQIKGMASKTAETFVKNIPLFVAFLKDCGLEEKIEAKEKEGDKDKEKEKDTSHPLYEKSFVITGVRDAEIQAFLEKAGARLSSSVSKNTVAVITKSKDEDTSKTLEAKKRNIPIYTVQEFKDEYNIVQ